MRLTSALPMGRVYSLFGHLAFGVVEQLVLDKHDRVRRSGWRFSAALWHRPGWRGRRGSTRAPAPARIRRICECWAPLPRPPPCWVRITSGTIPPAGHIAQFGGLVDDLVGSDQGKIHKEQLDHRAHARPSPRRCPGRRKPASLMGVSRTRSWPNSSIRSLVTRKMPPCRPISSPMRKTRGSARISSRRAVIQRLGIGDDCHALTSVHSHAKISLMASSAARAAGWLARTPGRRR